MSYIYSLTDTWNAGGTAFNGIKMTITNTASASSSYMLNLTTSGATTGYFTVDKNGVTATSDSLGVGVSVPATKLEIASGTSTTLGALRINQASAVGAGAGAVVFFQDGTEQTRIYPEGGSQLVVATGASPTEALRLTGVNLTVAGSLTANVTFNLRNAAATTGFRWTVLGNYNDGNVVLARLTDAGAYKGNIFVNFVAGDMAFFNHAGPAEVLRLTPVGNALLGTTTSPTTGTKCLTIATGTAPTATPADTVTFYSSDLSAGNTMLSIYTEGTSVSSNTGTTNLSNRIAVRVNGTVYYLLAASSA